MLLLCGREAQISLEFWTSSPLTKSTENLTSLREQRGHSYDVVGRFVFASDEVLVIDCGVLAYSERKGENRGHAESEILAKVT